MTFFDRKKIPIRYSFMGIACLLIMGGMDYLGFFQGIDAYTYDLFFRLRGPLTPSDQIMIAAIDEKTLGKLGRWPIDRHHYSVFLDRTSTASAVVFDIILAEPSIDDSQLADAMVRSRAVILPVYIDDLNHLVLPSPALGNIPVGHVHQEPSVDGVLRDVFHTLILNGKKISSMASIAHGLVQPSPGKKVSSSISRKEPQERDTIFQQDRMGINFYGPRGTFPYLSFSDILENRFPKTFFDGKILFVGLTVAGIDQDHLTPFSYNRNRVPGVKVQANILNNLMEGTDIKTVNQGVRWASVVLIFFLGFCLFFKIGSSWSAPAGAAFFLILSAMSFFFLTGFHLWIPPAVFFAALTAAWVMAHMFNLERMGALLLQAKKDWEISFHSIMDAIIIQDQTGHGILKNRSAETGAGDMYDRYLKYHAAPSTLPADMGLSIVDDGKNRAEIFDETLNRYFEVHRFQREDENRQANGMVHVIRDITEQKSLIKNQMALQTQLIQSQKLEAIGTLAGGIAHDFNNILTAIMGYTQLAAVMIPRDSEAQAKLAEILKASSRAANLVMQILSFSRRTEQEKIPVLLRPIVKEVLKLLRATLPPTIELRENIQGREKVIGDPSQIYQVILNLCTNASQALAEGAGQIEVTLESRQIDSPLEAARLEIKTGRYVKITVADTGSGIREDIKNRIFEPYFTTKGKETGTGLGLATTHGIVKNHGGSIHFESMENKGSTFHVYLPQVETSDNRIVLDENRAPASFHGRLLFVDDQAELVETGQKLLENLGYEVVAKNCPQKALEAFQQYPDCFDMVITDLAMKKMTGLELTEKILAIRQETPIILCTGYNDDATGETIMKTGVCSFVNKPFSIHQLADKIQELLKQKV